MKKILLALTIVLAMTFGFSASACSGGSYLDVPEDKNPIATFNIEYTLPDNMGKREITLKYELAYGKAPSTVANFVQLAKEGFYDNAIIYFVSTGDGDTSDLSYAIAGEYFLTGDGDEEKIERRTKNYHIKGEFESNKFDKNDLTHTLGALAMYREPGSGEAMDSASTAFYFVLNENVSRDRNYCVFGNIISSSCNGFGEVDALSNIFIEDLHKVEKETKTTADNKYTLSQAPKQNFVITKVEVETNGIDYSKARVDRV